jgi:hypothetical protein
MNEKEMGGGIGEKSPPALFGSYAISNVLLTAWGPVVVALSVLLCRRK